MSVRDDDQSDDLESDEELDALLVISQTDEGALTGRFLLGAEQISQEKEIAEQVAAAWRDPRFRRRMRNFRRSVRLGDPVFAQAETPLPDGAAVAVVRDPSTAPTRLIVVSRGAPESEVQLGRSTLRRSEIGDPDLSARTVFLRWADGRYAIMHGGVVDRSGTAKWRYLGPGTATVNTGDAGTVGEEPLHVPELGLVHLVVRARHEPERRGLHPP